MSWSLKWGWYCFTACQRAVRTGHLRRSILRFSHPILRFTERGCNYRFDEEIALPFASEHVPLKDAHESGVLLVDLAFDILVGPQEALDDGRRLLPHPRKVWREVDQILGLRMREAGLCGRVEPVLVVGRIFHAVAEIVHVSAGRIPLLICGFVDALQILEFFREAFVCALLRPRVRLRHCFTQILNAEPTTFLFVHDLRFELVEVFAGIRRAFTSGANGGALAWDVVATTRRDCRRATWGDGLFSLDFGHRRRHEFVIGHVGCGFLGYRVTSSVLCLFLATPADRDLRIGLEVS